MQTMQEATSSPNSLALAEQALAGSSARRLVIAGIRQLARDPAQALLIEETGACIFRLAGSDALRDAAEAMTFAPDDEIGGRARHHLLSGFWRA